MNFRVGQKVVCVEDQYPSSWKYWNEFNKPVKGVVYTVRTAGVWLFHAGPAFSLRLVEIINPESEWTDGDVSEMAFNAMRFRPVVSRKTDISALTRLLAPNAKILEGV